MSAGAALGVDFGTSHTVAVVRWPGGQVRPLLFDGSPSLPSAVYAPPGDGPLVVGRDAVHSARLDPARFEPHPKRRVDDGGVRLGDRDVPVTDLVAAVLARVAEEWRRAPGSAADGGVTLTCPATWGAGRRALLRDAAAAAGLGGARLVPEPVAAAAYFAGVLGRDVPVGSAVVVHDFGAGTFDASVVVRRPEGFEVLAVDGRADLGGLDVDAALVAHLAATHESRDPAAWARLRDPTTVADRRARRQLWDDVRVAKERLSRATSADVVIPLADVEARLTRDELERVARPILDQTVRVTRALTGALPDTPTVGVFLVGGASRTPLLATLLQQALGPAPVMVEEPELAVAEGSVLATSATPEPRPVTVAVPVGGGTAPARAVAPTRPLPAPPAAPVADHGRPVSDGDTDTLPVVPVEPAPAFPPGRAAVPVRAAADRERGRFGRRHEPEPALVAGVRPEPVAPVVYPGEVPPPWAEPPRAAYPRRTGRRVLRAVRALLVLALLVAGPVVAFHYATGDPYADILRAIRDWIDAHR